MARRGRLCDRCDERGEHVCEPRAERVRSMFETLLVHTKGRFARAPFRLAEWQWQDVIRPLFGTVVWSDELERWVRRYRTAWIEVPRKNGKSELLAGIALTLLCADDEEGSEVYGCALDRDQARKVFDVAARMVELSPALRSRLRVLKQAKVIAYDAKGSRYEAVPSDASGNLGHNPHGVIFDEVQEQRDSGLWDAMRQGMGTREQPMMVAALTAGDADVGFAKSEHDYSVEVAKNPARDPSRFVYIRGADEKDDWRSEETWRKANPALGDFKTLSSMRDEARQAAGSLRKQLAFRQFQLNQWVQAVSAWLDLDAWDDGAGLIDEAQLADRVAFGGLDLSSTSDLTALAWAFPPDDRETGAWRFVWRCFVPEAGLDGLNDRTDDQAQEWVRDGWLTVTEGNVLDYAAVRLAANADARRWEVREIGYDQWNAREFVEQRLGGEDGFEVVPVRQGFASLSAPSKEWERLVAARRIQHGGNPVVRWMIGHVLVMRDPAGNIKPDKKRSGDKIDAVVAAIMALDRATRVESLGRSAYEDHGLQIA